MTRRSRIWLVVAVLFTLVNLGGAVFALAQGELLHTAIHVALLFVGVHLVRRLAPGRDGRHIWRQGLASQVPHPDITDRLSNLEQSVDAVALEVERIGEGQRFVTRLFTERGASRAPGEGAGAPIDVEAGETPHPVRRD